MPRPGGTTISSRLARALTLPWSAAVAGLVFIIVAVALPLAPVDQSRVDIDWPASGETAESTTLLLTNQTPHELDLSFSTATARQAADGGGTILATISPSAPDAATAGLVVSADERAVTFATAGETWSAPLEDGDDWELHASVHGLRVTLDGEVVVDDAEIMPPQVDALITDVRGAAPAALSAHVQSVDDSHSVPTPLKTALLVLALVALAAVLVLLRRDDVRRRSGSLVTAPTAANDTEPHPRRRWLRALSPVDVVVVGLLTLWVFIGPMTDDDGYYAVMSYNGASAGYVGNYFQMFNQTFIPFTWWWDFYDIWQHLGGRSAAWLRLPALLLAIVSWFAVRSILDRVLNGTRGVLRITALSLLGATTFVWWAAYAIGTRPEPVAAAATVWGIALLARCYRRRSLLPAAGAVGLAALAFAAHPIGIVAAAPLVVSVPMLWSIAREGSTTRAAAARTIAVASVACIALVAAFRGGTLNDMLTGQKRFSLVETPLSWVDEIQRYGLLWADIPMGSFARRSVVIIGLVLVVWFVVFVLWSKRVGPFSAPTPLSLVGWSFALSFILMWITTSKWTHHFGSLSALGPLFITLMCVMVPKLVAERMAPGRGLAPWLMPVAVVSLVPAMILSLQGPDWWAYEWGEGADIGDRGRPEVLGISLANMVAWAGLTVVVIVVAAWLAHRRMGSRRAPQSLWAVAAIVSVFIAMNGGYLLATFVRMASPLHEGFTTSKMTVADPSGTQCLPEQAIRLWDAARGSALPVSDGDVDADGFTPLSDEDRERVPAGTTLPLWGSAASTAGTAELTTPWYRVPALGDDDRIGLLTAGDFRVGSTGTITARFRADGVDETVAVTDTTVRVGWSTLLISIPDAVRGRDDVQVSLTVADRSAVPGADIRFSAPALISAQTLAERSEPGAPTAVGWTQTFWFSCERPMTIAQGIIEPPAFATTYGPDGIDAIWVLGRGGSLAGVQRLATVNTPATGLGASNDASWGRVHFFDYPTSAAAYDVRQEWVTTPGWRSAFDPPSQIVAATRSE